MLSEGFGTKVADLYINWAFHFEMNGQYVEADKIFKRGIMENALPSDSLKLAHEEFGSSMSQRILHKPTNERHHEQQLRFAKRLEKISSLRTVGTSIKTPKSFALHLFDESALMHSCLPKLLNHASPVQHHNNSFVRYIIDSLQKVRYEKKKRATLACRIDTNKSPYQPSKNVLPKINLSNISQSCMSNTYDPGVNNLSEGLPAYDILMLNPSGNIEFSPEELMAYKWFKKQNVKNAFTNEQDKIWGVGHDVPIRCGNSFVHKNLPQSEWIVHRISRINFYPEVGVYRMVANTNAMYPRNTIEEFSLEQIMWRKRKMHAIRVKIATKSNIPIGSFANKQLAMHSKRDTILSNLQNKQILRQQSNELGVQKKVQPKILFTNKENKENIFATTNQLGNLKRLNVPKINVEHWETEPEINDCANESANLKLTTSIKEDIAAMQIMINDVLANAQSISQLNDESAIKGHTFCSTPIKKSAHNYSFSYELLETTAEFERLEALCAISP